jgi:hypothetical protein
MGCLIENWIVDSNPGEMGNPVYIKIGIIIIIKIYLPFCSNNYYSLGDSVVGHFIGGIPYIGGFK